jgi:hypothetical protein
MRHTGLGISSSCGPGGGPGCPAQTQFVSSPTPTTPRALTIARGKTPLNLAKAQLRIQPKAQLRIQPGGVLPFQRAAGPVTPPRLAVSPSIARPTVPVAAPVLASPSIPQVNIIVQAAPAPYRPVAPNAITPQPPPPPRERAVPLSVWEGFQKAVGMKCVTYALAGALVAWFMEK